MSQAIEYQWGTLPQFGTVKAKPMISPRAKNARTCNRTLDGAKFAQTHEHTIEIRIKQNVLSQSNESGIV